MRAGWDVRGVRGGVGVLGVGVGVLGDRMCGLRYLLVAREDSLGILGIVGAAVGSSGSNSSSRILKLKLVTATAC